MTKPAVRRASWVEASLRPRAIESHSRLYWADGAGLELEPIARSHDSQSRIAPRDFDPPPPADRRREVGRSPNAQLIDAKLARMPPLACGCRTERLVARAAERDPAGEVLLVRHVAVALHVAALAADDEQHEILRVARVRHAPRRGRLDVAESTCLEDALLALDFDAGRPGVDEVELVLRVVVV